MANLVEFIVKIRDMASGQFRTIASAGEGAFTKIGNRVNTVSNSVDQLNTRIDALTKTRDISVDLRQIRRANTEIDQLERKRDALENSAKGGGMGMFGGGLALAGIAAAGALGSEFISAGVDRQISKIALETFAGKKPGDLLNDKLVGYATESIYGNEIMSEGKLLAGSGVKANNIMPLMHMLGDLGAGDKEHMQSLALAFSEANSTGYLTGRQEMMMRTALFNPLEALSKITHKSGGQLKKDMEKGKISIDMLVKAMEYATGPMGRWNNMENKIAQDGAGKWIAFKGALTTLAGTIGTSLLPALGSMSDFMTRMVSNAPLLWGIAAGIGAMAIAWGGYALAANWAAIGTWAATTALWPILGIGAVVAALAFAIIGYNKYADSALTTADAVEDANGRILSSTDLLSKNLKGVVTVNTGLMENFFFNLKNIWLHIEDIFEKIGNAAASHRDNGKTGFAGWFSAMKNFGSALTGETEAGKEIKSRNNTRDWHRAMLSQGLQDDGITPLGKGVNPLSTYTPTPGGATPAGVEDTAKGVTGGGVRNLTINIAKQGIDQISIHVANLKEGKAEIQNMFIDMFNQVVNSGNAMVSASE